MFVSFRFRDPNVLSDCQFDNDEEKHVLMVNIKHRLTPHPVKIRAGKEMLQCIYVDQPLLN